MSACASHIDHRSLLVRDGGLKEKLSPDEFKQEVDLVRYALDRAYGAKGIIAESIFAEADKKLQEISFVASPTKLCKDLGEVLSLFPDQHLKVKYRGESCYKRTIMRINVGKNLNDTTHHWKGLKDRSGIYTIAITAFMPGKWPGFHEFLDEAIAKAKVLVIDLRGNGGGDDSIALEMAEKLAGQKIEIPFASDITRNTPETLTIWQNYLTVLRREFDDENMRAQIDVYLDETASKLSQSLRGELPEFQSTSSVTTDWRYDSTKGFQGQIYILQDRDCASSGESTIDFFEYFPKITRVGFNTAGMIHFGNLGMVVLPHSGIQINMPTKANRYKDGRFIEFIGIKPDVVLKDGEDAYEFVIKNRK